MRRLGLTVGLTGAIATAALTSWTGTAAASPAAADAASAPCAQGTLCLWEFTGFRGSMLTIVNLPSGLCARFGSSVQSYANYKDTTGAFYANANCTGQARPVPGNSEGDIGFRALSFRYN